METISLEQLKMVKLNPCNRLAIEDFTKASQEQISHCLMRFPPPKLSDLPQEKVIAIDLN